MAGDKRPARKAVKKAAKRAPRSATTGKVKAGTTNSPTRASDVLANMRQAEALKLRTKGHTFRDIAERLQVDVATAHRYVKAGLAELAEATQDEAKHLRELELARLDALLVKLWPFATGDLAPYIADMEAKLQELAIADPKAAKKSDLAKMLEGFIDGIPLDDYVKRVLDVIRLRARLLGLEAPVKHAATDPTGEEERTPVAFPVPPALDPAQWQAFAAKAMAQGESKD